MSKAAMPQKAPYPLALAPGDYRWCACGLSSQQPFCDGSHVGTEFSPITFTVKPKDGVVWLCGCKQSRRSPFCDGRHNKI